MAETSSQPEDAERGYRRKLRELQIELVKFQRHLIKRSARILVLIEGRDAAGKDGVIKHIVEHLSPRDTRVVALPAPSNHRRRNGIFSATSRICQRLPSSYCSTAPGTTGPVSSG